MSESQVVVQAGIEEALVKFYSKQFKISEEEARTVLQPILAKKDVLKQISSRLPEIQSMAEAISKLPPEMRQPMVDLVTRNIMSREDDEDMAEITQAAKSISKAVVMAKMMSEIFSKAFKEEQERKSRDVESLKADLLKTELDKIRTEIKSEVEKLKDEIKSVKRERRKSVLVKLAKSFSKLAEVLEVHERRFEEIEKKIETIQQAPVTLPPQQPPAQPQTESREGESKEGLRKKVKDYIREAREFLEEFGFEIRKPGELANPKEKNPIDKFIDRIAETISDKDVIRTIAETIKETLKELKQAQGQGTPVTTPSIPRLESYMGEVVGGEEGSKGSGATVGFAGGEVVGGEEGSEGSGVAEGSASSGSQ